MHPINPEYLSQYISFDRESPDWIYDKEEANHIRKIQAEGTAKLWNLLLKKQVALLADEVGMGKTYQALGVMMTLWRQKPNAKVLLYAPNAHVAEKWAKEYDNFIRQHYKYDDGEIRSAIDQGPMRRAILCNNHLELMEHLQVKWPSFLICKTSSLSNLLSARMTQDKIDNLEIDFTRNDSIDNKEEYAAKLGEFAVKCNQKAFEWSANYGDCPIDLLIFDEAHYLRRTESNSNKSISAHGFFMGKDKTKPENTTRSLPLAQKTLLLTATPNHSGAHDIVNIISLFNASYKDQSPRQILEELCVRRFRRLHGKTKHEYREELDNGVEMQGLPEKLFFMAYQRALVKEQSRIAKKNPDIQSKTNPYRVLFGYLEGFEFIPNQPVKITSEDEETKEQQQSDFSRQQDSLVIQQLVKKFKKAYRIGEHINAPSHPKYEKTIKSLIPPTETLKDLHPEKNLVFVRRIPSVNELSNRILNHYDLIFLKLMQDAKLFGDKKPANWNETRLRKFFAEVRQTSEGEDNITEDMNSGEELEETKSRVFNLFTVKKGGNKKLNSTDCSNFRLRFLKKEQLFSLFFEPGLDYQLQSYKIRFSIDSAGKKQFEDSAKRERIERINDSTTSQYLKDKLVSETGSLTDSSEQGPFETIFTLFLSNKNNSDYTIQQAQKEYLENFSIIEKEAFSSYLRKGILFASAYLIDFYIQYRKIDKLRSEELYQKFTHQIKATMFQNGLAELIAKAILSFKLFYSKELGKKSENLLDENYAFLNNTPPVYGVSADTNRPSILKAFNTPFYPNVLVATSVLQEGVDLHYQCNKVIHYGLAWTQGDNEQRVGRVDRLNGQMENRLKESATATLPILYPYLRNTIDEVQTATFIKRKHLAEKLIDEFRSEHISNEIDNFERHSREEWQHFYKRPSQESSKAIDPFPVNYIQDFSSITVLPILEQKSGAKLDDLLNPLLGTLSEYYSSSFVNYFSSTLRTDKWIFGVQHINEAKRHQPIIGELHYYEQGVYALNKPVFVLRVKTPIYHRGIKYTNIKTYSSINIPYTNHPLFKLCLNRSDKSKFKYHICFDIPIFQTNDQHLNLSDSEITELIDSFISFSDKLEVKLAENKDISNELIFENTSSQKHFKNKLTSNRGKVKMKEWNLDDMFGTRKAEIEPHTLEELFEFNHTELLLKYHSDKHGCYQQVGIYHPDATEEEIELLNWVFNTF